MKCIDKEGHDFQFVGYMVVAEKLENPIQQQVGAIGGTAVPYFSLPDYFPAKIEVWQCVKCGEVKLSQAVFSRL